MFNFIKNHKVIVGLSIVIIIVVLFISFKMVNNNTPYISYGYYNKEAIDVSIINLIVNPEKYEGKLVRVQGICEIGFEVNGVYMYTEDYRNGTNSIWISPDFDALQTTEESLQRLNGKCVLIEGIFRSKGGGMNIHFGSIDKISRYQYGIPPATK